MLMGGNDGFNVIVDGQSYGPFTPEWETEYARRTAVVMRELASGGRAARYWAPSPTARDEEFNRIYRVQNFAVERAAPAVPGARYVDLYTTIDGGRYRAITRIDGRRVISRQADGVHFTRDGALVPARLVVRAMARDYPALAPALPDPPRLSSPTGRPASWPAASTRRPCAAAPRTRCRPR